MTVYSLHLTIVNYLLNDKLFSCLRRRAFGSKRDEITGEWKSLHNEELHVLHTKNY